MSAVRSTRRAPATTYTEGEYYPEAKGDDATRYAVSVGIPEMTLPPPLAITARGVRFSATGRGEAAQVV